MTKTRNAEAAGGGTGHGKKEVKGRKSSQRHLLKEKSAPTGGK